MTTEALINPQLLRWAREREALTQAAAADRLGFKEAQLAAWESGDDRPTIRQAQTFAQKLGIPFGYLYLSEPPVLRLPLPDLRTVGDEPARAPTPELLALLADVLALQEWYRDYLEEEGAHTIGFVARFDADANPEPEDIAANIRETVGINDASRREASGWEDFLRLFIQRSEAQGVMVMRSGVVGNNTSRKLSVQEFRGFAISDDIAPLVFINGQDAKAAQIFTLAHELVHLWLGESGISNPNYRRPLAELGNSVERLCNRTAAELLVPSDEFMDEWHDNAPVEENVQRAARHFKVSSFVALRQAFDLGRINADTYWTHYDDLLNRSTRAQASGGGDFYKTLLARNSRTVTTAVVSALAEGKILHRDAARLLNVKVSTLAGVTRHVLEGA